VRVLQNPPMPKHLWGKSSDYPTCRKKNQMDCVANPQQLLGQGDWQGNAALAHKPSNENQGRNASENFMNMILIQG